MKRRFLHCWASLLALASWALLNVPRAEAWGCKGHQTVAYLAGKHLSPEARKMVDALLNENPIDPELKRYCGNAIQDAMADAATWPDDVRNQRKNGPWHYIDIPRGAKRGPTGEYCGEEGCILKAIEDLTGMLKDGKADAAKRAEALRYLIHFVGDLHNPLHAITNADEGGNCVPVQYFRRKPSSHNHAYAPNLHALWDTAIPERDMEGADPAEFADTLEERFGGDFEAWRKGGVHPEEWAWESFDLAEANVYGPLTPKVDVEPRAKVKSCTDDDNIGERMWLKKLVVGDAYQSQAAPVAERRLAQAGLRLALLLNEAAKTAAVKAAEKAGS